MRLKKSRGKGGQRRLRHIRLWVVLGTLVALLGVHAAAQSTPEGQLIIAFDTSIAATYFDPAETAGLQTPFVFLYALHDALLKPLPGNDMAPCLAESWTESPDAHGSLIFRAVCENRDRASYRWRRGNQGARECAVARARGA